MKKKYFGSCHCKKNFYSFNCSKEVTILKCNCSICIHTQYLHLIIPHKDFTLLGNKKNLKKYKFGTRTATHYFCNICGIKSFYQPRSHKNCYSINYNSIIKPPKIKEVINFNGKSFEKSLTMLNI